MGAAEAVFSARRQRPNDGEAYVLAFFKAQRHRVPNYFKGIWMDDRRKATKRTTGEAP